MRKYAAQLIALCVLIAIVVAIRLSGADSYLTVENLRKHKELLEQFISARYTLSVLVYMLVYLVSVAFSVPGATVLTLAGGFLFHLFPGVVYVVAGATLGATFAFLLSRYILGNTIQNKYGVQLQRFNRELDENGHLYLLTVRFIPVFPFFLINILSGLTKIPLWTYVWTTSVGILPGSLVYTFAGSQLGTINSVGDLLGSRILIAFLLLAALTLVPLVLKKIRAKSARNKAG
jgi:uncharacterized membrane protein YdjX (TVP38/TMEM64 family)